MRRFPGGRWLLSPPLLACLLALIFLLGWTGSFPSQTPRKKWGFDASEASTVVVVCARGSEARIVHGTAVGRVEVSARPRRIPNGYHAREAEGREVAVSDWPFGWTVEKRGTELQLHAAGETRLKHCRYLLDEVEIRAPIGVRVTVEVDRARASSRPR